MSPVIVKAGSFWVIARPKSVIQRCPRASTIRFDGLMSRWTTPIWWACSSASAA